MDWSLQAQARPHGARHRLRPCGGRQRPGRSERRAADCDSAAGAGARGQSDPNSDSKWQLGDENQGSMVITPTMQMLPGIYWKIRKNPKESKRNI